MKHQIIYTHCENDFYTDEPGFGIASASRGFPIGYKTEVLKRARYTPPRIPDSTVLSPEICALMPENFSYFKVGEGVYALGRVKLTGRCDDGYNSVSHFIVLDRDDNTASIEYAGSSDLICSADAIPSGYCSDAKLDRGEAVNLNKVMKFLSDEKRQQIFARMLKAALVCKRNGGKVIIADKPENILMWIGAVTYALPSKAASALTFDTYVADPSLCREDICGVFAKGTAYSPDKVAYPDVVFDMYEGIWQNEEPVDEYCAYIANGMAHDYKLVYGFNDFVEKYFDFKEPTFDIDVAFGIYTLLKSGFTSVSPDTFKAGMMLLEHSSPALMLRVSEKMISEAETLGQADPVSMIRALSSLCMPYPHASVAHKTAIRECVCKCIFMLMIGEYSDEQSFETFYSKLDELTVKAGFSLTNELMSAENRRKLIAILTYKPSNWKTDFAVKLLVDFIVKNNISSASLTADSPLGTFVHEIVSSGEKAGVHLDNAVSVISPLSQYCMVLCSAYSRAYAALSELSEAGDNTEAFRQRFAEIAAAAQLENRDKLFEYFMKDEDYKTVYTVYASMMKICDGKTASDLYTGHYQNCFSVNADYCSEYLVRATEDYFATACSCGDGAKKRSAEEIFDVIYAKKVVVPSNQACIDDICSRIQLSPPSDKERERIEKMSAYMENVRGVKPTGKLLTLIFALECEKIDNKKDYTAQRSALEELTSKEKVNLSREEGEGEEYFGWILPIFAELLLEPEEIEFVYDRFILSKEQSEMFFEEFAKEFIKLGKDDSDYTRFCHFLKFVFKKGSESDKEVVASLIKKLNSKRMEILTVNAENVFSDAPAQLDAFSELISMPVKKQGFFSGLFKKK